MERPSGRLTGIYILSSAICVSELCRVTVVRRIRSGKSVIITRATVTSPFLSPFLSFAASGVPESKLLSLFPALFRTLPLLARFYTLPSSWCLFSLFSPCSEKEREREKERESSFTPRNKQVNTQTHTHTQAECGDGRSDFSRAPAHFSLARARATKNEIIAFLCGWAFPRTPRFSFSFLFFLLLHPYTRHTREYKPGFFICFAAHCSAEIIREICARPLARSLCFLLDLLPR